jgi:hypothetical protein
VQRRVEVALGPASAMGRAQRSAPCTASRAGRTEACTAGHSYLVGFPTRRKGQLGLAGCDLAILSRERVGQAARVTRTGSALLAHQGRPLMHCRTVRASTERPHQAGRAHLRSYLSRSLVGYVRPASRCTADRCRGHTQTSERFAAGGPDQPRFSLSLPPVGYDLWPASKSAATSSLRRSCRRVYLASASRPGSARR